MYHYFLYGTTFESDFKLYNLTETACLEPQVYVRRISDGFDREKFLERNINYKVLENGVWFSNQYGQFFILDGNKIEILPDNGVDDLILSTFICGWCIAFLFAQRGYSAIHSTALETTTGCILISGNSGAGKSTTAMELMNRGHRYLADDIAMVSPENGFMVNPAFPIQKMCRDVAERDGIDETMLYIDPDKDKFARENTESFCSEPRELKSVFLLKKAAVDSVQVRELNGIDKFMKLINSLFLLEMYDGPGMPSDERFRVLKIAEHVKVVEIERPIAGNTINEIADMIEELG